MADPTSNTSDSGKAPAARGAKAAAVLRLLTRNRGATMAELIAESGWQAHTVRAHLSGLRKKHTITKETRRTGEATWRLGSDQVVKASDDQVD
jgi:DNA-binding IclR family transcriptional regulator